MASEFLKLEGIRHQMASEFLKLDGIRHQTASEFLKLEGIRHLLASEFLKLDDNRHCWRQKSNNTKAEGGSEVLPIDLISVGVKGLHREGLGKQTGKSTVFCKSFESDSFPGCSSRSFYTLKRKPPTTPIRP